MRRNEPKVVPHIVKTIITKNGTTVHICDNYYRDISPEELERRRNEARRAAWRIIHKRAEEGIYL